MEVAVLANIVSTFIGITVGALAGFFGGVLVVTMFGMNLGYSLGGLLVIEEVFGWPGIGTQAWQAIQNQDIPMILGTVLFASLLIVAANLIIDLLYPLLDPRIAYSFRSKLPDFRDAAVVSSLCGRLKIVFRNHAKYRPVGQCAE